MRVAQSELWDKFSEAVRSGCEEKRLFLPVFGKLQSIIQDHEDMKELAGVTDSF